MAKAKAAEAEVVEVEGLEIDDEGGLLVDLTNTGDGSFPLVPRSIQNCTVFAVEFSHSQASSNPMWTWQLDISDGEYEGQRLFYHTVFTAKGMPRVKQALIAVGAESLLETKFNPEDPGITGQLEGLSCRARVDVKPYLDGQSNNVKSILAPSADAGAGFLD